MAHAFNPSTWEAEAGGFWVQGQPGKLSVTLFEIELGFWIHVYVLASGWFAAVGWPVSSPLTSGQPGLQSEFQDRNYTEKPCLEKKQKQNKQTKKKPKKPPR